MNTRPALWLLVEGATLVAAAYLSAWFPATGLLGAWAMILGCACMMSGMLALAALRSGVQRGVAWATAAFLFALILVGFGLPILLPPDIPGDTFILGLPLRPAIEIYGVGLLPFVVLPFVFGRHFNSHGLDPQSLARLRAEAERLRGNTASGSGT